MLECGPALFLGDFDVAIAGGIQRIRIPAEGLNLFDGALREITERAGPIHGVLSAEFVPHVHGIPDAECGILPYFGRFGCRTGSEHGVVKGLCGDHGTADAVSFECAMNVGHYFRLAVRPKRVRRNDIAIVRTPIADADSVEFADDIFEGYRP